MTSPVPSASEPILEPGSRIGEYEVTGVLGRGGMGVVYRARDLSLHREVALKTLRPDRVAEPEYQKRAMREARMASRLSHPNIVRVLDVFEVDGLPAIVMELVEGPSLRSVLDHNKGGLPLDRILDLAIDVARALGAAHAAGVLHRDVNPNNILLVPDGRALLADFGLARRSPRGDGAPETTDLTSATDSGHVVGTPGYMAPEQLLGRPLDGRTDIFAFGVVLYEMCTGTRAFAPASGGELIDGTLHGEPTPIGRLRYGLPEELERIVRKAMAKRPDERYQEAKELEADLRALRRRSTQEMVVTSRGPSPGRRRLLAGGAALLAVLVGLFAWRATSRTGQAQPLPESTPRQLTDDPARDTEPAISPDGSFVAFTAEEDGRPAVVLADTVSGQTLRLASDAFENRSPAWFPDGSGLAFVSNRGGSHAVWKTTRLGGHPVLLVPDASDPAISPDGTRIAFVRASDGGVGRVWVAPLADLAAARCVSASAGFWSHRRPAWSPDGTLLTFQDWDTVWLVPAAGGEPRKLTTGLKSSYSASWSGDGRHIYLSSREGMVHSLWRVPAPAGGLAQRLTLGTGSEDFPSPSADGKKLAYATTAVTREFLLLDLETGDRVALASARDPIMPFLAADSSRLYYVATNGDKEDVLSVPLSGRRPAGEPQQATNAGDVGTAAVSPDGKWLALHRYAGGERDIWIQPASGGPAVRLVADKAAEVNPAFSRDGRFVAYSSDEGGNPEIRIAPLADGRLTGPPRQLTKGRIRLHLPDWSPDGRFLVAVGGTMGGSEEVWLVPADGSAPPRALTQGAHARRACFGAAPDVVYVSGMWGGGEVEVRKVPLAGGPAAPLTPRLLLGNEEALGMFSVSTDGRLLAGVVERLKGDVWLLSAAKGHF